jgi:hypothetical protein
LLLGVPQAFQVTAQELNPDGASPRDNPSARRADSYPESEDDIFSSSYEREMLARRFFQKTLPPLSRKEKIVWAFKTARTGILL